MGSLGESKRPNFLVIVADDLGYSDVGPFGSEIPTPALDFLANTGVRLTNFHTASACSPTRSMLFSGTDHHIAGLGQMAEHMPPNARDAPGYEGYLNFRVAAMSEILQDAGYETMMAGKWHLGTTRETAPCSRGFDQSFVFLSGCHNHYNYEPHLEDPKHSVLNINAARFWMRDSNFIDRTRDIPSDFYSSTSYSQAIIDQLDNRDDPSKPFFAYLAFTAPHWPLQAPQATIATYKGHYDSGPDALRAKRLAQLTKLGLISPNVVAAPMCTGPSEWADMTPAERADSARKMEVFAAMVDLIDESIGKVLDHLESIDELDNTFILFMSDNGAEGALLEAMPIMGGASNMGAIIDKYFDNSLENIGNPDSYVWYGPQWATASMAPSRGFKTWITEGGIRCPCIVRYPPAFGNKSSEPYSSSKTSQPIAQTGQHTDSFATVMDILPTILSLAEVPAPDPALPFRNRNTPIAPIRGTSWLPHLTNKTNHFHTDPKEITGWELFNSRAIRQGAYKALWMAAPRGKDRWELYDVEKDPGEVNDLAESEVEEHKRVLERLVRGWEAYVSETGLVLDDEGWGKDVDREVGMVWGGR